MIVNVRGARVHTYPVRAFGELAYIRFDRDDAASSCATLPFHALPVHVRKGSLVVRCGRIPKKGRFA